MQSSHHSTVWSAGFVNSEAIKTLVSFVQMWTPVTLFLDFQIKKKTGLGSHTCDTKSVPQHRCFCLSVGRGNITFSYLRQESIKCSSFGYLKNWFQILIWNSLTSLAIHLFLYFSLTAFSSSYALQAAESSELYELMWMNPFLFDFFPSPPHWSSWRCC